MDQCKQRDGRRWAGNEVNKLSKRYTVNKYKRMMSGKNKKKQLLEETDPF